jgi:hypothetical protein
MPYQPEALAREDRAMVECIVLAKDIDVPMSHDSKRV